MHTQVFDKVFMSAMLLLSTFWEIAKANEPAQDKVAVLALDALAYLQFCRVRLPGYSDLLQALLSHAAGSPAVTSQLLQCLPCYAEVASSRGTAARPAWLADAVLASRVHFLMSMLTPCAALLGQVTPFAHEGNPSSAASS